MGHRLDGVALWFSHGKADICLKETRVDKPDANL